VEDSFEDSEGQESCLLFWILWFFTGLVYAYTNNSFGLHFYFCNPLAYVWRLCVHARFIVAWLGGVRVPILKLKHILFFHILIFAIPKCYGSEMVKREATTLTYIHPLHNSNLGALVSLPTHRFFHR